MAINASLVAYAAIEMGHFKDLGLEPELVKFTNSNSMMAAFLAGEIDVAMASAVDVLIATRKYPDKLKIFRLTAVTKDNPIDAFIVKKDAEIKTMEDLRGKQIGVFPGATMTMYLRLILEKELGQRDAAKAVPMPPGNLLQALASGSIDAVLSIEPIGLIGEEKGISRYLEKAPVEKNVVDMFIGTFSVISQEYIDESPDEARKCVEAFARAVADMRRDPASAAGYYSEYIGLPEAIAKRAPYCPSYMPDEMPFDKIDVTVDLLVREGILDGKPDFRAAIYSQ
jgi:NitT/TauT family transport system substrate-binding protein